MSIKKDEPPMQSGQPIIKAKGVTPSECHLAQLAESSFLNLWSYPSPYRDKNQSKGGDGKELCDLLVVCGQYVVIFSEKTIAWPSGNLKIAWSRWARRAVRDSVKQMKGAESWITRFPKRIFLDRKCTNPFPIAFPEPENRIIHRVIVARGASEACKKHTQRGSGSLIIEPGIRQDEHWQCESGAIKPFVIGDVDPSGPFVHVIDEVSLEVIMRELDTIRDFSDYLEKKAKFIRSGRLLQARGEENLLAYYAIRTNEEGEHDFVSEAHPQKGHVPIKIDGSCYESFINNPRYVAKKLEDESSYLWDNLIETFTTNMLNGTSITLDGSEFDLKKHEDGVRYMALERRLNRRNYGEAIGEALEKGRTEEMFFRLLMNPADAKENETAFFILTVQYPGATVEDDSYEDYRTVRAYVAITYAKGILTRYPHLGRIIGISCEPPGSQHEVSEEMVYAEQVEWTEEERQAIRRDCEICGILRDDFKGHLRSRQEFPEVESIIVTR